MGLILFLIGIGIIVYHFATAPDGYQDEQGFHRGHNDKNL